MKKIYPQIKKIVFDIILSVADKIDVNKKLHCFELFGLDFMIDGNFEVKLLEVNANPCLET